jgi:hypothetical protein
MMNPNGRLPRNLARPGELSDAQGGALFNKMPQAIPWEVFLTFGIRVLRDGKPLVLVLEWQPADDVSEVIQVVLLLIGMMTPKPGPIDWATVPENIRRHFREVEAPNPTHPS